ncbi:hypothetical protein M2263_001839 [Providencia alcalifaciens]|nr:hypothetical protein [Providencia alcalifaciens]
METFLLIGCITPFFGLIACVLYTRRALRNGFIILRGEIVGDEDSIYCRRKSPKLFWEVLVFMNLIIMICSCGILIVEALANK